MRGGGGSDASAEIAVRAAIAVVGLVAAMPASASAQRASGPYPELEPWTDSADPAALKACREKLAQPSATTKVGPLVPLRNASLFYRPSPRPGPNPVRESNVRMYGARVDFQNFWGVQAQVHQVCFFEKLARGYRFIQVCETQYSSMKFRGCDLSWIVRNADYDKLMKVLKSAK
jgi:hypothetical protein